MNKPNNMKGRQRGRNGGKGPRPMGGGGGRGPGGFDGGAGRMRGNAQQLMEKYLSLARDASSAGDRVLAENYFQHADHYYRVLNARFEQQQQNGQHRRFEGGQQNFDRQGGGYNNQGYNPNGQDRGYDDQQPRFDQGGNQQQPDQHHYQPQHQPQHQHQPQQQHVQPQQQREPQPQPQQPVDVRAQGGQDSEIGLPPGILGMAPAPQAEEQGEPRNEGEQDERRNQGRRRRGRGDRAFAGAGE